MSNKYFLISGINGQDGTFLAMVALKNGYKVVGIQRPKFNKLQNISNLISLDISNQIKFEIVDLENSNQTNELIKKYKPEYFAHLGSQSNVVESETLISETINSNQNSTANLIKAIRNYSKDTCFFFPSSATIYEGYSNITVDEDTIPKALSTYAKSKLSAQEMIIEKASTDSLKLNIGIMFSHESEFRGNKYFTKIISNFLTNYKQNSNQNLNVGNLTIKRDIGYAGEYVDAIFNILQNNKSSKYIISKNRTYQLSEYVKTCLDYLEIKYEIDISEKEIKYIDRKSGNLFLLSNLLKNRNHDLTNIQGNNLKIFNELNWKPKLNIDEIATRMMRFEENTKLF